MGKNAARHNYRQSNRNNYQQRELQVMEIRSRNRSLDKTWVPYPKYKKANNCFKASVFLGTIIFVGMVGLLAITVVHNDSTTKSIMESYEYEQDRADARTEELESAKQDIVILQDNNAELEREKSVLTASLEDATDTIASLSYELDAAHNYIDQAIVAPSTKQYTPNTDLGVTEVMTVDRMNRIIDFWIERNQKYDSPFIERGDAFIKASQESGLDPIFIFAICCHESAFGTTRIAKDKFNYMGIGAYDSTPYESANSLADNVEGGIIASANWVADRYYNEGQTTLYSMIYGKKCYSTSKDSWINGINSIMKLSATID